MLTSLEIKNFRAFSHLIIERLGRVNLIVGKNNVGKTTLLEALQICGSTQLPSTVRSILDSRNEVRVSANLASSGEHKRDFDLPALWRGRKAAEGKEVQIGVRLGDGSNCEFRMNYTTEDLKEWSLAIRLPNPPNNQLCYLYRDGSTRFRRSVSEQWLDLPVDVPYLLGATAIGTTEDRVASWWDAIWMSSGKQHVLELLQTIAAIEDVIYVKDPRHSTGRIARARVAGTTEPMPLSSIGDGARRYFQIALAMEFARYRQEQVRRTPEEPAMSFASKSRCLYSLVLIDEIDTGIHHTMHRDLWRFIFWAARSLDVQLFATTHSLDCLHGFAEAATEDEESDAQVIRLERERDEQDTRAVVIDREKLPIVVRDSIEVR